LAAQGVEHISTPVFTPKKYKCGPASRATLLVASGAAATPEALESAVYIPGRRGSLQVEMLAAPRSYSRLALPLPRMLESIIAELQAGRPVLVLHNYGLKIWPRWHYAVVVGYDPARDMFLLRSGVTERREMRTRPFMVYWHHAGRWAMVVLRPGETAANDDARRYLEAAADFERVAQPAEVRAAFDAAVRRWPREPVALIGRGTAEYRLGNLAAAAHFFAAALRLDSSQAGARNNLAQTYLDLHCARRARELLEPLDVDSLTPPLRAAVRDTLRAAQAANNDAGCAAIP
jgi:tetratricopeptide (TPR) repeat protein